MIDEGSKELIINRERCAIILGLIHTGAVMVGMQFRPDENVVENAHTNVAIEVANQPMHAHDQQENRAYILVVTHEPDRENDRRELDHHAIQRMKDRVHNKVQARRRMMRRMCAPQEAAEFAATFMHSAVNGIIERLENEKAQKQLRSQRHIAGRADAFSREINRKERKPSGDCGYEHGVEGSEFEVSEEAGPCHAPTNECAHGCFAGCILHWTALSRLWAHVRKPESACRDSAKMKGVPSIGYGSCKMTDKQPIDRRIARTKAALSAAMFELLQSTPRDDINVRMICEKADVVRKV